MYRYPFNDYFKYFLNLEIILLILNNFRDEIINFLNNPRSGLCGEKNYIWFGPTFTPKPSICILLADNTSMKAVETPFNCFVL